MIDRLTVEKIKEAANIVDVVSEFVSLKKSGSNYKGLCPFHNERTPSFFVSPSRGTCHCFGCGKGGNAITFLMELRQMTYPETLRWLADKYHIEIKEKDLTDEERRQQSERESMLIVMDWAAKYFEKTLHETEDGKAFGQAYFRSRGFRDDTIERFRLGYDLQDRFLLASTAKKEGYKEEYILKDGLCYKNEHDELIDRFAGRVIFPWMSVSGKVIGFSGRVLDARTKGVMQKYVNSPDSEIFHKGNELYGIYQAKQAIAKNDRVYLVEGQADVISMYQCGIENVVAGSGTALTPQQIHLLHRFTSNITLIYDDDEAGHHAALRGTDMLLQEGMNLKVLLLPGGDDPDSFARKHTAEEFRQYIREHETDFIAFKTRLLTDGNDDPQKRSEAINSIVNSISLVQDAILRDTYIHECSERMQISENTLINQMNRFIRSGREAEQRREERRQQDTPQPAAPLQPATPQQQGSKVEDMMIRLVILHGEKIIYTNVEISEGDIRNFNVAQYFSFSLSADGLMFQNPVYNRILDEAVQHSSDPEFKAEPYFIHHADLEISKTADALSVDHYQMAVKQDEGRESDKFLDEQAKEEAKRQKLRNEADHLLLDFRLDYAEAHLRELQKQISLPGLPPEQLMQLMKEYREMQEIRNRLAKMLGNDIVI